MSRPLSSGLEALMTTAQLRRPSWRVWLYDVRSTTNAINDVAIFNTTGSGSLLPLTGPREFTGDVTQISVEEQRGDYAQNGVQSSSVTLQIVDEHGLFDPIQLLGLDPAGATYAASVGRYLRAGNVVVIRIGDAQVPDSQWPFIFTGEIVGQAGRARSRSDGAESVMTIRALSREAHFLRFTRTSDEFTIGQTYRQAAVDVAENEMGLDPLEINFGNWGSQTFGHRSVQLVDETPMAMLAKLMFVDGVLPRFDGLGRLTQISSTVTGAPDRIYQDLDVLRKIDRSFADVEVPNCVTILGLDANLSKVLQPVQLLASADITTGFFAKDEEITVYWSEDQTLMAENVTPRVVVGINSGISILGGDEEFEFIDAPGGLGGTIGVVISVSTGYAPWIVIFFLVHYVVLAAIPDAVASFGLGETISIGRIIQALALAGAIYTMTKIGRGKYEFHGAPFENVYKEIRGRACVGGVGNFDRNTTTIENHLVSNQNDADNIARRVLFLLRSQANPRSVEALHDLHLEPDDIFEVPGARSFLIDQISYTLARRGGSYPRASYEVFETTPGVQP